MENSNNQSTNMLRTILLTCGVLSLFASPMMAGGGWTQRTGKGYIKISEWWLVADQHFTTGGGIDPNVTTGIFTTSVYGEYGITDRLTAVAYVPFFTRNYMNNLVSATTGEVIVPGEALSAFGDVDLTLKYGIIQKPGLAVSVSLTAGLPTGNPVAGAQQNLQTGDGEFNQIIQVDAGFPYKIGKLSLYGNVYTGFNNRTNGFSEEIRYGLETGTSLLDGKFWLIGRLFGVESLKNGDASSQINSTSIFANNSEYTSYSIEAAAYLTKTLGVSANFTSAFRGEIIFASPSYSVGVFLDLSR